MQEKSILQEDFKYIIKNNKKLYSLKNSEILVTGATGLVGSLLVKFFLYLNKYENLNITIYALVRNKQKAEKIYSIIKTKKLHYIINDLKVKDSICFDGNIDYIFHFASITKSKLLLNKPVDSIETIVNGTSKILDLAVRKKVKSMVYVSSMEAYGQINSKQKITESDLGYVDLTNPRSCYPEGKRLAESLCVSYGVQYGINVKIARLAQTFGAGILSSENRVFAQFARSLIKKQNIILHTLGNSEGNYIYTADALGSLIYILVSGEKNQFYNVVNEKNHSSIKEMAELVINNLGSFDQKVIIEIPQKNMGYAPDVHMKLSGEKVKKLGWIPQIGLLESYERMIKYMKEQNI